MKILERLRKVFGKSTYRPEPLTPWQDMRNEFERARRRDDGAGKALKAAIPGITDQRCHPEARALADILLMAGNHIERLEQQRNMQSCATDSVREQYNELAEKHNAVCLKLQQLSAIAGQIDANVNREGYTADGNRAFVATALIDRLIDTAMIDPEASMAAHNDVLVSELAKLAMTALPTNTSRADVAVWLNARANDHREAYRRAMQG